MKITVNKNAKTVPTKFSWQFGVGNDHAFQLHRKDVCDHVKLVHDELGMKYIRFHGIFDDDMLCFQRLSDYKPFAAVPFSNKIDEINFKQIADVFDNVLACGMKPFVELSFMPGALASGKKTGIRYLNNITRPKSMDKWVDFIKKFIKFLSEYYGSEEIESWYFEVSTKSSSCSARRFTADSDLSATAAYQNRTSGHLKFFLDYTKAGSSCPKAAIPT